MCLLNQPEEREETQKHLRHANESLQITQFLDYGSLASAIELKRSEGYDWVFPKTSNTGILSQFRVNKCLGYSFIGRLRTIDEPKKFFPCTRPSTPQFAPHYFETKS